MKIVPVPINYLLATSLQYDKARFSLSAIHQGVLLPALEALPSIWSTVY